jgi:hypothetical protein
LQKTNETKSQDHKYPETPLARGLLIFFRLERKIAARINEIGQKQGVFQSIETLDAFRYGKINQPQAPGAIFSSLDAFSTILPSQESSRSS